MPEARPYTLNDAQHHFLLSWMWRRVADVPGLRYQKSGGATSSLLTTYEVRGGRKIHMEWRSHDIVNKRITIPWLRHSIPFSHRPQTAFGVNHDCVAPPLYVSETRMRRIASLLMCFLLSAGFELRPGGVADCGLYGGIDYFFLGFVDTCGTVGDLGGI